MCATAHIAPVQPFVADEHVLGLSPNHQNNLKCVLDPSAPLYNWSCFQRAASGFRCLHLRGTCDTSVRLGGGGFGRDRTHLYKNDSKCHQILARRVKNRHASSFYYCSSHWRVCGKEEVIFYDFIKILVLVKSLTITIRINRFTIIRQNFKENGSQYAIKSQTCLTSPPEKVQGTPAAFHSTRQSLTEPQLHKACGWEKPFCFPTSLYIAFCLLL